jgi:Glycosyl hydrolase 36 superfamily, catalytic domain
MGYFRKRVIAHAYSVDQVIFAPFGDDPILVSQVTVENRGMSAAGVRWIEYWGCQMYQFSFRSYMEASVKLKARATPELRRKFGDRFAHEFKVVKGNLGLFENKHFLGRTAEEERIWQQTEAELSASNEGWLEPVQPPSVKEIAMEDLAPPPTFLVSLDEPVDGFSTNGNAFFAAGGMNDPSGAKADLDNDLNHTGPESALLVERQLHLEPGETRTIYFAYGYLPEKFEFDALLEKYRSNPATLWKESSHRWKEDGLRLRVESEPWIERETVWHSYYLRSGLTYDSFFQEHIISQGGVYQYLRGFQGEADDALQHAFPFIFSNPSIAKEVLRYTLKMIQPDGSIPYAIVGNGRIQPYREVPGDQELWLLWIATEYILATRDTAFMDEEVQAYPLYASNARKDTVRNLLIRCYRHLWNSTGTGEHNILRLLNADWWDDIGFWAQRSGYPVGAVIPTAESVLNSAMGAYVMDYYACLLKVMGDTALAADARSKAAGQRAAVRAQWNGRWFRRAFMTPAKGWVGDKHIWLDVQSWAIVGGAATPEQKQTLVQTIDKLLRQPSPIGAIACSKGGGPTKAPAVWASLNTILIWALSLMNKEMAWDEWKKNSMAHFAETYPDVWYGIWSGSDHSSSVFSDHPGQLEFDETLLSSRAAQGSHEGPAGVSGSNQTDFPIMNMHWHANPIYRITKLVGLEFNEQGFSLAPTLPLSSYSMKSPLIGITKSNGSYEGWYAPLTSGVWKINVRLPPAEAAGFTNVEVNGRKQALQRNSQVDFQFSGESFPDKPLRWVLRGVGTK